MGTPNPRYDPNWRIKWQAAILRLDVAHDPTSEQEMFKHLDSQYPTLEEYHAELLRRFEVHFPNKAIRQRFPLNASESADEMQVRANELWRSLVQEEEQDE